MPGLLYDTGALLAAERGDRAFALMHRNAVAAGVRPVVPSVVLAQAWRGGPQARLSLLLKGCRVAPVDEPTAKAAGVACARSGTSDVVDAVVVVLGAALSAAVVTSDPDDLGHLATSLAVSLPIHRVLAR